MLQAVVNVFRISDLRTRVMFTLGALVLYRIGFFIPLPGVDQEMLVDAATKASEASASGFGRILEYASVFSGGDFGQSTIFGLGIMPYITASIVFQLLQSMIPSFKEMKKDPSGAQKLQEWTRYAGVGMCMVQGFMWLNYIRGQGMVDPVLESDPTGRFFFMVAGLTGITAGSVFLMWLGEQIDKYGIGNGVSLILTAGILAQMPNAIGWVYANFDPSQQAEQGKIGLLPVIFLIVAFVGVTAGAIVITIAQRRIPIQQAKHTRGRRVFGGQRHYLPLRVNHAGVMPIIFASSLMIFPSAIFGWMATRASQADSWMWWQNTTGFLQTNFQIGQYPYILIEIVLIYFFSYFWTTVQFSPDDMSKQLKDHGSFIPGLRPGPRTAEYLETVMERITFVGAGFLAIIAVIPAIVAERFGIPFMVSQFLGGTGLLIVVSVSLDLIQRIEANLLMRNYSGFLSGDDPKGPRVRSGRS
jgi:preprotein translocase subunit SecY